MWTSVRRFPTRLTYEGQGAASAVKGELTLELLEWKFGNSHVAGHLFTYFQHRGPKLAKPKDIIKHWKLKTGDQVAVISGKDKGRIGTVLACDRYRNQVKVEGCNLRKVYVDEKFMTIEKKVHYSNVQLLDPVMKEPTRIAVRLTDEGEPIRISTKSGAIIPWPESRRGRNDNATNNDIIEGPKDTPPEKALQKTYDYQKDVETMLIMRQTMAKYNRELH